MEGAPQLISAQEMRRLLRAVYARDRECKLFPVLALGLRDPAMPLDATGRPRAHPLWLALFVISLVAAASFFVFTLVER